MKDIRREKVDRTTKLVNDFICYDPVQGCSSSVFKEKKKFKNRFLKKFKLNKDRELEGTSSSLISNNNFNSFREKPQSLRTITSELTIRSDIDRDSQSYKTVIGEEKNKNHANLPSTSKAIKIEASPANISNHSYQNHRLKSSMKTLVKSFSTDDHLKNSIAANVKNHSMISLERKLSKIFHFQKVNERPSTAVSLSDSAIYNIPMIQD